MELIGIGAVSLLGVIGAAISLLLANEFKEWAPRFTEWLVRHAIRALPEERKARYGEEWRSHLCEIPGPLSKVVTALGFTLAARRFSSKNRFRNILNRWTSYLKYYPRSACIWGSLISMIFAALCLYLEKIGISFFFMVISTGLSCSSFFIHNQTKTFFDIVVIDLSSVSNFADRIRKLRPRRGVRRSGR